MPLLRIGAAANDDWPTLGWGVIDLIEEYVGHGPGDISGQPFELDDEECQLLLDLYRLYPKRHDRAGQRVVTRGVYSRSKGRRKSELAGAIVVAEGFGEVRFDGWAKNEPRGRPVIYPFIRCLATEEGQTGNTYDNVRMMLRDGAEAHPEIFAGADVGLSRTFLPGGADAGEIRPSTAGSASKDGGKETFAVQDEPHLYTLPELREMSAMVRRNLRKRKIAEPWMLDTTTAPEPGAGSVAEDVLKVAVAVSEGRARCPDGLYVNWRWGEVEDWSDDAQVLAGLHEAYGEAVGWMDLGRILSDEIRVPGVLEADSRRYWTNEMTKGAAQAFDTKQWAQLEKRGPLPDPGELITLGFDGARHHDATGLIATHVASGHQFVIGIWELDPDDPDAEVDVDDVDATLTQAFERWKVWRMYPDPYWWEDHVAAWQGRWGEKTVVPWWTNRRKQMAFALRAYRTAMDERELTHDGDVTFARHIGNARRAEINVKDEAGKRMWVIRKEHGESPLKIDAAMAGCLSWEARRDALAAGALNAPPEPDRTLQVH